MNASRDCNPIIASNELEIARSFLPLFSTTSPITPINLTFIGCCP